MCNRRHRPGSRLVIRADASTQMGTGHLMRCMALGQAWQETSGRVVFVTSGENNPVPERLLNEGFDLVMLDQAHPSPNDLETTLRVLDNQLGGWLVCDGYHFGPEYQRAVKQAGYNLMVIDDYNHLDHYYADMILNQNLHADDLNYSCESYTRLLLGPRYSLLRREFRGWSRTERETGNFPCRVLVTMGGSDPNNMTAKIIRALELSGLKGIEVWVIIGGGNPYRRELEGLIKTLKIPVRMLQNVSSMPELMAEADLAITAGGSTVWELAFMGLPSLVIVQAENQRAIAESLDFNGVSVNLGWYNKLSDEDILHALRKLLEEKGTREKMTALGQRMVDGLGAPRVVSAIRMKVRRHEDTRFCQ